MATFGPEIFKTKSGREIVLRHCLPTDAGNFAAFQQQVASETTFTLQVAGQTPSIEKVRENWQQSQDDPLYLRLGAFDGNRIVAQLGFRPLSPIHPWTAHVGQFGMMVLQDFWGQGIGRRMLEIMDQHAQGVGIARIEAMVRVRNERGVSLYLKSGYSIEGIRRCAAKIDGEYWGRCMTSMHRPKPRCPGVRSASDATGAAGDHSAACWSDDLQIAPVFVTRSKGRPLNGLR